LKFLDLHNESKTLELKEAKESEKVKTKIILLIMSVDRSVTE